MKGRQTLIWLFLVILFSGAYAFEADDIGTDFNSDFTSWPEASYVWHLDNNLDDAKGQDDLSGTGTIDYFTGIVDTNGFHPDDDSKVNSDGNVLRQSDVDWTVALWAYPTSSDAALRTIFRNGGIGSNQLNMVLRENNTNLELYVDNYGVGGAVCSAGTIPTSQWIHLTVTWDDSENEGCLFVNGDLNCCENTSGNPTADAGDDAYFGNDTTPSSTEKFLGYIDDIVAFDEELSNTDINTLTTEYLTGSAGVVNYTYTPSSINLDHDNGTDSVLVDFNNLTQYTGTPTFYQWDVNGVNESDLNYLARTFVEPGDYNVTLITGDDNNSTIAQKEETITVSMFPQDFNLTYVPDSPLRDGQIQFTFDANENIETSAIKELGVDFGDGNTSYFEVLGSVPYDFNHSYSTGGDFNIVFTASTVNDLNNQNDLNIPISSNLTLYFVDENTSAPINPSTFTIDGNDHTGDLVDGNAVISLAGWANKNYTIVASVAGKTERQWNFDLNSSYDFNYMLTLLDTNKGQSFDFVYYKPDLTVCATCTISHMINNIRYAERRITNSSGEVTFFLNPTDANYFAYVDDGTTEWIYSLTRVESRIPKDEEDLFNLTPYSLDVGGLATLSYTGQTTDLNVLIQSNTVDYYSLTYDINTDYLDRTYLIRTTGQDDYEEIQPYLVKATTATVLEVRDSYDNTTIEGVRIVITKTISGEGEVTVEEVETDAAGTASVAFVLNDTYDLTFYYNDEQVYSASIEPIQNVYYIYLNLESSTTPGTGDNITAYFYPSGSTIDGNTLSFDLNQLAQSYNGLLSTINISVDQNGSNVLDSNYTAGAGDCNSSACFINNNFSINDFDSNGYFTVTLTITTTETSVQFTKTYYLYHGDTIFSIMKEVKDDLLGGFGALIISLVITVVVVGAFATKFGLNPSALLIPALLMIAIFTIFDWIDWRITLVAALAGLAVFVFTRRVS